MDSPEAITVGLTSLTIFWEDLGLPKRSRMVRSEEDHLAKFWDSDIQPWMDIAIRNTYNPHEAGVWFLDRQDAILFKLRWSGQIPL